jgi:hypothetical protein
MHSPDGTCGWMGDNQTQQQQQQQAEEEQGVSSLEQ